jgi:phosphoribosyl 1,2-cyclic phosphodiesterase
VNPFRSRQRVDPSSQPPERADPGSAGPSLGVRCWGTRGSIPAPGPDTVRFGGNTPCLEVTWGDAHYTFDAGSGLRLLGDRRVEDEQPVDSTVFLTHFHWDHIQGFPFFVPLYDAETRLRIVGPPQDGLKVQQLFAGQMGPIYFPVPFHAVEAELSFHDLPGGEWSDGTIEVTAFPVRHESLTLGYHAELAGRRIVFIPDNELVGGHHETQPGWRADLVRLLEGADLLIHDAMLTADEYPRHEGWGHSTFLQAIRLAGDAGVRKLLFFHHAPHRTDDELDRIVEASQQEVARLGLDLELDAAREGIDLRF